MPRPGPAGELALDTSFAGFGGFEWAVPAVVLTVPGLLLMIAVLTQAAMGAAFLPLARRWLGGDRAGRGPGRRPRTGRSRRGS